MAHGYEKWTVWLKIAEIAQCGVREQRLFIIVLAVDDLCPCQCPVINNAGIPYFSNNLLPYIDIAGNLSF